MFSVKKHIVVILALAGPGLSFAQSDAQPPVEVADQVTVPVSDVLVQQQLDWRSCYLHRIDGSRTEGRTEQVPGFRPGV